MKRFINYLVCAMAIFIALAMGSCQSDEPGIDYGRMRIGKMNLNGAKQLALRTDDNKSRAIDGEFLSAGLYKINEKGEISAVGIYFTTDSLGNRLEKEYALRIAPRKLFKLTSNYIIATNCDYYDVDGDIVSDKWIQDGDGEDCRLIKQNVPYAHLLVRLTDGKVWCIDNIIETIGKFQEYNRDIVVDIKGTFKEGPDGVLYQKIYNSGFKYNLMNDDPSFEQIVEFNYFTEANGWLISSNGVIANFYNHFPFYYEDSDLLEYDMKRSGENSEIEFAWPHSGFQRMEVADFAAEAYEDDQIIVLADNPDRVVLERDSRCAFFYVQNKPYVLLWTPGRCSSSRYYDVARQHYWKDVARLYEISTGNNPGSVKLKTDYIMLTDIPESAHPKDAKYGFGHMIYGVCASDDYIITFGTNRWITVIDLNKREWRWVKQLNFQLNLESSYKYADRIYVLNEARSNLGVYWFDINTLEDGFTPFNIQIPDYMGLRRQTISNDISDIIIEYSGRNPATGDEEHIYIDITTGEVTQETSKIEMIFETLISLS